jgi:hypothetical protein
MQQRHSSASRRSGAENPETFSVYADRLARVHASPSPTSDSPPGAIRPAALVQLDRQSLVRQAIARAITRPLRVQPRKVDHRNGAWVSHLARNGDGDR